MPREARKFDLVERTQEFTRQIFQFVKQLPDSIPNRETIRQLVRSAASVGANYIEANEGLGRKDFLFHLKISRKEAKESRYWLQLLDCPGELSSQRDQLVQESSELLLIFSAMIRNSASTND